MNSFPQAFYRTEAPTLDKLEKKKHTQGLGGGGGGFIRQAPPGRRRILGPSIMICLNFGRGTVVTSLVLDGFTLRVLPRPTHQMQQEVRHTFSGGYAFQHLHLVLWLRFHAPCKELHLLRRQAAHGLDTLTVQ